MKKTMTILVAFAFPLITAIGSYVDDEEITIPAMAQILYDVARRESNDLKAEGKASIIIIGLPMQNVEINGKNTKFIDKEEHINRIRVTPKNGKVTIKVGSDLLNAGQITVNLSPGNIKLFQISITENFGNFFKSATIQEVKW